MAQPGLSEIDKAVERPLWHKCCQAFASAASLPNAIAQIPGATEQITSSQSSKPRAQNPNLVKAPVGKIGMSGIGTGSTSRSKQYLQDIKDKREEGSTIPDIKFTILFDDGERIDTALDAVVTKAQEYFAESFPTSPKVYRLKSYGNILCRLNNRKYLATRSHRNDYWNCARAPEDQQYIPANAYENKRLYLRLIVATSYARPALQLQPYSSRSPVSLNTYFKDAGLNDRRCSLNARPVQRSSKEKGGTRAGPGRTAINHRLPDRSSTFVDPRLLRFGVRRRFGSTAQLQL
ncbi:hypothetical protein R3P38DRAFT_2807913 [Favolaschia claudopus]|uniref:Uncharacterized protein n=1 Tax=Favolaschia claudopus TaxID=2862362 RepID=A0AAV9ZHB8_9AGAR